MIDIKKLITIILSTVGISGLLSVFGIVLVVLNWNHEFKIKDYDMNDVVNSFLIVLLVVYCIFILIHTRGKYAEAVLNKIGPLATEEKLDVEEEVVRPRAPSNKIEIKKPRRNSITVKPQEDGSVQIDIIT